MSGLEDLDCRVSQERTNNLPLASFTLKGLRAEPEGERTPKLDNAEAPTKGYTVLKMR